MWNLCGRLQILFGHRCAGPVVYSLSAVERADRILSLSNLGDRMTMDLMDNMFSLLGLDEGGFLFL